MFDLIDNILTEGPSSWPLKYRRIFALTLPISGPLYLVLWGALMIGLVVTALVLSPFALITSLLEKKKDEA